MAEMLTLKAAAEELGVHYMTAYRYVRLGMLPARKSGSTWEVSSDDIAAMKEATSKRGPARSSKADWAGRLRARLLAADEAGAWGVVEAAMSSGMDATDVYLEMIGPTMRWIGEAWAAGELDVADEHRATAVAIRVVSRLGPHFARRGRSRGRVIVGAPPGDAHSLAPGMIGDLLRGAGFEVMDLGGNVPTESLVRAAREAEDLVAVVVSSSHVGNDDDLARHVAAVREASSAPVLLGGSGVQSEEQALRLGADGWAPDAPGAMQLVDQAAANR